MSKSFFVERTKNGYEVSKKKWWGNVGKTFCHDAEEAKRYIEASSGSTIISDFPYTSFGTVKVL